MGIGYYVSATGELTNTLTRHPEKNIQPGLEEWGVVTKYEFVLKKSIDKQKIK